MTIDPVARSTRHRRRASPTPVMRLDCTFTNTSSDVAPGTIATYAWTFGDGAARRIRPVRSHTYTVTAATDFTVTLTVTDNEGATDAETQTITVTPAAPVNPPPTAGFTHSL